MKRITFILFLLFPVGVYSQSFDTLRLDREEIEAIFLNQNLLLIAEKMNIDMADAALIQAKVWNNPTLSINDVNLWTTGKQREALYEAIPDASDYAQFTIELNQLITTAGKRRKEVAVQQTSKEMAVQQFGEMLRGLKTELRKSMNELVYCQQYETVVSGQVDVLTRLINAYEKQVQNGNMSKGELLRLQASSLELENERYQLQITIHSHLKTLKSLLNLPHASHLIVILNIKCSTPPGLPGLADLFSLASENRPDMKFQQLQTDRFAKTLSLEKARRFPDITFGANYDRYAGVWHNYFGFGLSFDLPVFNRNQGNIKAAAFGLEQSGYLERQIQNEITNEIAEACRNYEQALEFYRKIAGDRLLSELDELPDVYMRNLLNRNIGILEFIDFMDSYQKSKQIFLEAQKSVNNHFEELQFVIGTDLN